VDTQESSIDVKEILENEEFQNYLQSFSDRRVSEAIRTNEKKWKKRLNDEKKKIEMSQEELLNQKEKELHDRELKLEKIEYFKEKEYDLDLIEYVSGEDIDEIKDKADVLVETINKMVEKQVEKQVAERLKSEYTPPKENNEKDKDKDSEGMGEMLAKQISDDYKLSQDSQNQFFK
jgi:hypothetical protein